MLNIFVDFYFFSLQLVFSYTIFMLKHLFTLYIYISSILFIFLILLNTYAFFKINPIKSEKLTELPTSTEIVLYKENKIQPYL